MRFSRTGISCRRISFGFVNRAVKFPLIAIYLLMGWVQESSLFVLFFDFLQNKSCNECNRQTAAAPKLLRELKPAFLDSAVAA